MVAMRDSSKAALAVGRFAGWEPLGFEAGDENWYRFVENGPTGSEDPLGLQVPTKLNPPQGIRYAPNKPGNSVVADGDGGLMVQVDPRQGTKANGQDSKHKESIIQITKEHERIHVDDLSRISKTPAIDTNGKPVPKGTLVQFSSRTELGKSEVRATTDSLKKLRELRKNETVIDECKYLDEYIQILEDYRKKNLALSRP